MAIERDWDVLLIGGASGSGKTIVGRQLVRKYSVDYVRVDDFQVLLDTMTTPDSHPAIHYWRTHPDWMAEGADAVVGQLRDVGEMLIPGLTAVIHDHLEENIPMIMEGDFILPQLSVSVNNPKVKAIFIHEPDKDQILRNYQAREGEHQPDRAEVSHAYGKWLADNCRRLGFPVMEARPWDSLMERVTQALRDRNPLL